jgi:hypothetical protein
VLRGLVVVSLVCACGSHGAHPTGPKAPAAPPAASNLALPPGPPLATPGEHMTYRLSLGGVELATYELAIGNITDIAGKRAIVVQTHAKSIGLANVLAHVDDYFTSWIDVSTGRPLRWMTDEYASKGKAKERTDAEFCKRDGDVLPILFHMNDDPPTPEPQKVSMPDVWDYNAFLIALRTWEAAPGSQLTAEVLRSRYMWHVVMTMGGKEKLVTDLGELPALRLDGHTYKLTRDETKAPDDERNFTIWISADDGRVPLKVVAKTDYGDITMQIVDYQPGTGKRLRE